MRIIMNGSGYELIDLDRKLKNRVLCNLRQRNLRLMKDCLEDAFQLADDRRGDWTVIDVVTVAAALFEKLASKSFTELFAAETKVTHELKETWKMQKRAADREYYEELCKDTDGNVLEQGD